MKLKTLGLLVVLALPASASADAWSDLASRHEHERDELGAKFEKQRLEWSDRIPTAPAPRSAKSGAAARSAAAFKEFQVMRREQAKQVRVLDQRQIQEHEALRVQEAANPTARAEGFARIDPQPAAKSEIVLDGGGVAREIEFTGPAKRTVPSTRVPAGSPVRH